MGQNEANQLFSTDPHCANLGGGVHRVVVSRPKSVINLIVGGS